MGSQGLSQDSESFHGEMQDVISALKKFPCCLFKQDKSTLGNKRERFKQQKIMNEAQGQVSTVCMGQQEKCHELSQRCMLRGNEFRLDEQHGLESDIITDTYI